MSPVGVELRVTEDLMQGALDHEMTEDLTNVVPGAEAAQPVLSAAQDMPPAA
ncbi:hypothetical protein D3C86_2263990 [compost metagenome]